ncbi:MAG: Hsp20/alpha crystallin family protein [Desulfuromonadaceae bacterium]|nr:Hsp20/alpha crystallin family protein [Desulfuromonadaceae bacterium]
MQDTSVVKKNDDINVQSREETRASERYLRPAVDIIEAENGLTMIAVLPGAAKDTLEINVDKGILTVNAPVSRSMPGSPLYSEFEYAHYYRQFTIPESMDHEKAKADFTNGVLTLRVPVAESAKPRKIEVKAG